MASILFKKASSNIYENSGKEYLHLGESLYIRKATFFDIYESELRKVNN